MTYYEAAIYCHILRCNVFPNVLGIARNCWSGVDCLGCTRANVACFTLLSAKEMVIASKASSSDFWQLLAGYFSFGL